MEADEVREAVKEAVAEALAPLAPLLEHAPELVALLERYAPMAAKAPKTVVRMLTRAR